MPNMTKEEIKEAMKEEITIRLPFGYHENLQSRDRGEYCRLIESNPEETKDECPDGISHKLAD
jgi:hypothetical protein